MIGALFGAFVVIALLLWAGIWYHRYVYWRFKRVKGTVLACEHHFLSSYVRAILLSSINT